MTTSKGRVAWPALLALCAVLAGGSYAMGRGNVNPFRGMSVKGASKDSIEFALSLYKRCGSFYGEAKTDCYSKPLDSLASQGQVRVAMGTLAHLGILDLDVKRDGHVFAHGIGIAGEKSGGDIAKTFAMCDESNQSGCYHGVIQAYFASAKKIGPTEVNGLCDAFRGPTADRWIRFQCVHGTGHGLEMIYAHDLPKALAGCDLLGDDWDRRSCYGGAFMENIVDVSMPKHPAHDLEAGMGAMAGMDHGGKSSYKEVNPADPLYPCSTMAERYLVSCYEMQTSVMLYLNKGDIGASAKTCDTAPVKMRYVCYQSLGRDISSYAMQDHAKSIQMCSLGKPEYQPWCYFGLVKNFIDLNARADDGLNFCKKLTGEANKMKCYEAVGEEIGTLRNESGPRAALCEPSEPYYLEACLFGARVSSAEPKLLAKLNAAASGG